MSRVIVIHETSRDDFEDMIEAKLNEGYMFMRETFKVYTTSTPANYLTHYVILMAKFLTPIARIGVENV